METKGNRIGGKGLEVGSREAKGMRFADRGWRIEDKRIKVKAVENSVSSEW